MKKIFVTVAVVGILALTANAQTSLALKLEADAVASGNNYDVRIYAQVTGTGTDEGLADTQFTISSSTTTGVTDSVEQSPPPSSGNVKNTWAAPIAANFTTMSPLYQDVGGDSDMDAFQAAFTDMQAYTNLTVGQGGWTLLATQTWKMNADQHAWLDIDVSPISRHFDWGVADPYKSGFDSVSGQGVTVGVPEPATMALLGVGGVLTLLKRRRR